MTTPDSSRNRVDAAWQMVTCKDCGKHYQCTPSSDYYASTTLADGVCERCLLASVGMTPIGPIHSEDGSRTAIIGKAKGGGDGE